MRAQVEGSGVEATAVEQEVEVPVEAAPARPGRGWASRAALAVAALAAMTGALQCRPQGFAAKEPRGPRVVELADPTPRVPTRWSWPAAAAFRDAAEVAARDLVPIQLAWGTLSREPGERIEGVALSIEPAGETFTIRVEHAPGEDGYYSARVSPSSGWRLSSGSLAGGGRERLRFEQEGKAVEVDADHLSPADLTDPAAIADWSYVATLLASDPPVYADRVDTERWDSGVEESIRAARERGDHDAAIEMYRSNVPMGRCSMDERPAEVAREYADLCYQIGKLGCFLQLQLRIMGNRFDRVAYSSYGEAAAMTQAERLADTGIDVDRFFVGLMLRYAGIPREGGLGAWRLARSIKEAGRTEALAPTLAQMAEDRGLDEYNRLRATQLLASLDEDDELDEERLPEAAQAWLVGHRAAKAEREKQKR